MRISDKQPDIWAQLIFWLISIKELPLGFTEPRLINAGYCLRKNVALLHG